MTSMLVFLAGGLAFAPIWAVVTLDYLRGRTPQPLLPVSLPRATARQLRRGYRRARLDLSAALRKTK